jgi:hypothetical protein
MAKKIVKHTELDVYRKAFEVSMEVLVAMINNPSDWLIG